MEESLFARWPAYDLRDDSEAAPPVGAALSEDLFERPRRGREFRSCRAVRAEREPKPESRRSYAGQRAKSDVQVGIQRAFT